jgi:hypothetical protein
LYFNKDLNVLKKLNLIYKHFQTHEKKEERITINRNKNNNISFNNSIIFINHDSSLTGAPLFLYDLILYFNEIDFFRNIILLEPYPNDILKFKLEKINGKIIYFYNNDNILEEILDNYNPNLIYSNSITLFNIQRFKKYYYKSIFHYHETYKDKTLALSCFNVSKTHQTNISNWNFKTYVECKLIQTEYQKNGMDCNVFHPFLSTEKINTLNIIKDNQPNNKSKYNEIVFGMCGTKINRKGYDIFLSIVKEMPQFKFIWIGGNIDTSNNYDNYIQIPQTNDPFSIVSKDIDYMLITSREDPCPFVILESLYLNTPCIILENNIKYVHNIDKNYYVIPDHNNDFKIITEYVNKMNLIKKEVKNNNNLSEYITNNFINPKILQNININAIDNKICLFLSLYNINDEELSYYKNIVNILNLTYDFQIDIILLINTGEVFNNDFNYIEHDNYTLFGVENLELINELYLKYSIIKNSKIIFVPNKGTDWGAFLIGLNYCEKNYEYIIKLHSKTNIYWREMLMDIIYKNVFEINENNDYDTFLHKKWYIKTNIHTDDNLQLLLDRNDIFNITEEEWYYIQGSVFITKYKNLTMLKNNFKDIYNLLNDVNSYDKLWIDKMDNDEVFNKTYLHYSNSAFNKPISENANIMRRKYNSKNYFELINQGYRGIPDYATTYAIERYLGYLICFNKKICLV